jgi:hypothetical protein
MKPLVLLHLRMAAHEALVGIQTSGQVQFCI